MDSIRYPVHGLGPDETVGELSFSPNGTSNPTLIVGSMAKYVTSIAYSATGIYTITFNSRFRFPVPPHFMCSALVESLANYFAVIQVGTYDTVNKVLVLQAIQAGSGYAVPASSVAGTARVNVATFVRNSSGK